MTKIMSSREFNHDVGKAKRAAKDAPVVITDRGRPAYVLMKYEDYRPAEQKGLNMFDRLYDPEGGDFEFDPPRVQEIGPRPVEFD
jgi:Antitoxin Phd_YefM, type II toxin-antitoxin system